MKQNALINELVALCKPRVIELLITTALPSMFLAANGFPHAKEIFGVLIGGTLAAGSANAINSIIEKDNDINMPRTRHRPMPQKRIKPIWAWIFALTSQIAALLIVGLLSNWVASFYTLCATLTYVFIYTIWLKPRSDQNIVIGGAAGAFPVVIGYSAAAGSTSLAAWLLFALVFLWTPAHFWALAIFHIEDYKLGGFPMRPITVGIKKCSLEILFYAIATVGTSLLLISHSSLGAIYTTAASLAGLWFIYEAFVLAKHNNELHRSRYMRFFHVSNGYLALVFIALALDSVL